MQPFSSKMKFDPFHRFWLTIGVAIGGLSPMPACAGDFSDTAFAGLTMAILFPFVLALLTLAAPQGTRLLVFGFALVGLPLLASITYSFIQAFPDEAKAAAKLWFISTATVAAAWLSVLIRTRFRRLAEGSWKLSWNPARLAAGVLIFLSAVSALEQGFHSRDTDPWLVIGNLAFHVPFIVIFVNLWRYRSWAWWTVLVLMLGGITDIMWRYPSDRLHADGWLAYIRALVILVLLLLPSTRRQCSR